MHGQRERCGRSRYLNKDIGYASRMRNTLDADPISTTPHIVEDEGATQFEPEGAAGLQNVRSVLLMEYSESGSLESCVENSTKPVTLGKHSL